MGFHGQRAAEFRTPSHRRVRSMHATGLPAALGILLLAAMADPHTAQAGLSFDGVSQYVTFGRATNLGTATFTLETWFSWNGGGVATTTGSGGTVAAPWWAGRSLTKT